MIKPTIGRVVIARISPDQETPYPALVTYVWSDRLINVGGFDSNGRPFAATSIQLIQDDDAVNSVGYYCEWMPYQKEQAKKTEELEAKLTSGT